MAQFKVNGEGKTVDGPDDMPLLWALRDNLGLTGTKYGCGTGLCGACTVNMDGAATKSCQVKLKDCGGASVQTIEGLGTENSMHVVQKAWLEENVSQCGYCQPGQIMAAAVLLAGNKNPSDKDIDEAMSSNLCRCGTYPRIRKAVKRAAELMSAGG